MGKFLVLILTLVVIVAIGGLLYRPATVIGVSEKSLASSIRGVVDADRTGDCEEHENDEFTCEVFDPDSSGSVGYDVDVGDYGCWDATAGRAAGGTRPAAISGCITILDLARGD